MTISDPHTAGPAAGASAAVTFPGPLTESLAQAYYMTRRQLMAIFRQPVSSPSPSSNR